MQRKRKKFYLKPTGISVKKAMRKHGQGYYLLVGRMRDIKGEYITPEWTELCQFSGTRIRHLRPWCEHENFVGPEPRGSRLRNWFTQFEVEKWNFEGMHYTKVKYLGKNIIDLISRRSKARCGRARSR